MANHKTFEQRHLRSLDKASADQPAREEREFFWRPEDVARYLHLSTVGAIRSWLAQGLVTDADGWVKIGEMDRFLARVVKARIVAGLFGKGLDPEGKACPTRRVLAASVPSTLGDVAPENNIQSRYDKRSKRPAATGLRMGP